MIDRAQPFNPITGQCRLCNLERFFIIFQPEKATLNSNLEDKCPHKWPKLLKNS